MEVETDVPPSSDPVWYIFQTTYCLPEQNAIKRIKACSVADEENQWRDVEAGSAYVHARVLEAE